MHVFRLIALQSSNAQFNPKSVETIHRNVAHIECDQIIYCYVREKTCVLKDFFSLHSDIASINRTNNNKMVRAKSKCAWKKFPSSHKTNCTGKLGHTVEQMEPKLILLLFSSHNFDNNKKGISGAIQLNDNWFKWLNQNRVVWAIYKKHSRAKKKRSRGTWIQLRTEHRVHASFWLFEWMYVWQWQKLWKQPNPLSCLASLTTLALCKCDESVCSATKLALLSFEKWAIFLCVFIVCISCSLYSLFRRQ